MKKTKNIKSMEENWNKKCFLNLKDLCETL